MNNVTDKKTHISKQTIYTLTNNSCTNFKQKKRMVSKNDMHSTVLNALKKPSRQTVATFQRWSPRELRVRER